MHTVAELFQILFQGFHQHGVGMLAPLLPGKQVLKCFAKPRFASGSQRRQGFRNRQQPDGADVFAPALGVRVEVGQGIQLVAEEFQPDGLILTGGVDIGDAAPESKLTGALHHAAAAVARGGEPGGQFLQGVFLPHLQADAAVFQNVRRHGAQAQGLPGENLDGHLPPVPGG